jgi:hypothetical protein
MKVSAAGSVESGVLVVVKPGDREIRAQAIALGDKNWRILTRLRTDPGKATALLRALLVLTRQHTTR